MSNITGPGDKSKITSVTGKGQPTPTTPSGIPVEAGTGTPRAAKHETSAAPSTSIGSRSVQQSSTSAISTTQKTNIDKMTSVKDAFRADATTYEADVAKALSKPSHNARAAALRKADLTFKSSLREIVSNTGSIALPNSISKEVSPGGKLSGFDRFTRESGMRGRVPRSTPYENIQKAIQDMSTDQPDVQKALANAKESPNLSLTDQAILNSLLLEGTQAEAITPTQNAQEPSFNPDESHQLASIMLEFNDIWNNVDNIQKSLAVIEGLEKASETDAKEATTWSPWAWTGLGYVAQRNYENKSQNEANASRIIRENVVDNLKTS